MTKFMSESRGVVLTDFMSMTVPYRPSEFLSLSLEEIQSLIKAEK